MGAVLLSAVPGLITLAVESLSSWIKGKQNQCIGNAIDAMRRSDSETRSELQQKRDDFLMYGKYSAESLNDIIKTVNALHQKNTKLEKLVLDHQHLMLWLRSTTSLNYKCSWNKLRKSM